MHEHFLTLFIAMPHLTANAPPPGACMCSKPLCRRMIVVEGVYANSGDVAPLKALVDLKEQHRYRLCVEESHALGVLGASGRGACEAAGLQPGEVRRQRCGNVAYGIAVQRCGNVAYGIAVQRRHVVMFCFI
jgi:Aminotransferase class I and II